MPSKKYNFLQNDEYDSRIPLYSESAFQHGIVFTAKYIGTLDIRRPTTRVDIVSAMRRIRYEFKAKGVKKKKVTINISADGVKCSLRKKRRRNRYIEENEPSLMHHPIYRIFYVSHDSQDLKIFSYIARDENSNTFKCNVFKSNKKSQAMRIVRTVGQAFEVCHKITLQHTADPLDDQQSEKSSEASSKKEILTEQLSSESGATTEGGGAVTPASETTTPTTVEPEVVIAPTAVRPTQLQPFQTEEDNNEKKLSPVTSGETYSSPLSDPLSMGSDYSSGSLSTQHEMRLLKEQLKHTQAALDQQQILREQLKKETEARIAAQARTHHLLVHNKELLDYIAILVGQIQEMEKKVLTPQTPQMPAFSEPGMVPSVIQESLEEQQRQQQQQLSEQQLQPQQQHVQQSSAQQRSPVFQRQFTPDSFLQTNQVNVPNLSPRQPPTMNTDNVYSNLMLQQLGGFAVTSQQQQQQQAASSPDQQQQQQQWLLQRLGEIQMSSPLSPQPIPFGKSSELLNQCKLDGTAEDQSLAGQQLQNFGPLQNTVAAQLGALGPDALAALRLVVPMHSQEMQYASILQPPPQGRRAAADQSGGSSNSMSSERVDSASSSAENVRVQEMNRQNLMQQQQLLKQLEQMQVGASPGNPGMVLPQLPRLGNPPIATMGAITRTSSEKVPPHRRDETIAQIQRSAWGRHTTNN